jgi:hypothetical protein
MVYNNSCAKIDIFLRNVVCALLTRHYVVVDGEGKNETNLQYCRIALNEAHNCRIKANQMYFGWMLYFFIL